MQGRLKAHGLPATGMLEPEHSRVQGRPQNRSNPAIRTLPRPSVDGIPAHRQANRSKVNPDLMGAPGFRVNLKPGNPGAGKRSITRQRVAAGRLERERTLIFLRSRKCRPMGRSTRPLSAVGTARTAAR